MRLKYEICRLANTDSLRTKTAAVTAMRQMAVDESVRGLLIQQGALKICIEIANDDKIEVTRGCMCTCTRF